ncbi:MAG: hypothetical protein J6Q61_00250 [Bacteroidales bacterium]|nr:hypothetical protein [Bacteroidales bacterium]
MNLSNILGAISFLTLICIPGAVEAEMYVTAVIMIAIMGLSAYFALKEDGQIRK